LHHLGRFGIKFDRYRDGVVVVGAGAGQVNDFLVLKNPVGQVEFRMLINDVKGNYSGVYEIMGVSG